MRILGLTWKRSWLWIKFKMYQWFAPLWRSDYPTNVQFYDLTSAFGTTECQLVTFKYRGKAYRGHLEPHSRLDLSSLGSRCSMKRPTRAVDGSGRDVTTRVREFWGPAGNWGLELGLCFRPELEAEIELPLEVKFNDLTNRRFYCNEMK